MPKRKTVGTENLVGQRIAILRKKKHMRQKELLAKLQTKDIEISQPGLSALEGQTRKISDRELIAVAEILEISLEELTKPNEEQ